MILFDLLIISVPQKPQKVKWERELFEKRKDKKLPT